MADPRQRLQEVKAEVRWLLERNKRPTANFFQKPGAPAPPQAEQGAGKGQKRGVSDNDASHRYTLCALAWMSQKPEELATRNTALNPYLLSIHQRSGISRPATHGKDGRCKCKRRHLMAHCFRRSIRGTAEAVAQLATTNPALCMLPAPKSNF